MVYTFVSTGVDGLKDDLFTKGNPRNRWIEDLIGNYIGFVEDLLPYGQLMSQIAFYCYELLRQTDYSDPQVIISLAIEEILKDTELTEEMVVFLPDLLEILLDEIKRLLYLKNLNLDRWELILAEELEKKTWFGSTNGSSDMLYT